MEFHLANLQTLANALLQPQGLIWDVMSGKTHVIRTIDRYYELEQAGLGAACITEVRRCTEAIADHPEVGPTVLGAIRRRLCQRFPQWTRVHWGGKRTAYSRGHESQTPTWVLGWQNMTDGPTRHAADGATCSCAPRRPVPSSAAADAAVEP